MISITGNLIFYEKVKGQYRNTHELSNTLCCPKFLQKKISEGNTSETSQEYFASSSYLAKIVQCLPKITKCTGVQNARIL